MKQFNPANFLCIRDKGKSKRDAAYKAFFTFLLAVLCFFEMQTTVFGQANCVGGVPTYTVDFTGNPTGSYTSPTQSRQGNCCSTVSPDRCVHFIVTSDAQTAALRFEVTAGPTPPGSLYWQIDCGPIIDIRDLGCITGGTHDVTFCKPGNNPNGYTITSIPSPIFPPDDTVRVGCSVNIPVYGLDTITTSWTSIPSNPVYESYLSCTSGCINPLFTPQAGAPAFIDYRICGTVTARGCSGLPITMCDTVRMYVFPQLAVSVSPNPATFCPTSPGVNLVSTATGGFGSYSYIWNNGVTASSYFATAGGTYSLTVTDNLSPGCPSATVTVPVTASTISSSISHTDVACNGASTGSATISASAGSPPYVYSWSNGASTSSATGLAAGTYSVTVSDQGGCSLTSSTTLTQPPVLSGGIDTANTRNITCNGNMNGYISIFVSGGVPSYTFLWSPGGYTTQNINNLDTGTYIVTVTDANNCTTTLSQTLTQPGSLVPITPPVVSYTHLNCFHDSSGTATVQTGLLSGTPPYTYLWSNGATVASISGLSAQNLCVLITDANQCTANTCFTITEPLALASGFDSVSAYPGDVNVSCPGASDGAFSFHVTGGTAPYSYLWSTGATTQNLFNIPAGPYCVTITDANGCGRTDCITLIQPTPLTDTLSSPLFFGYNISCKGQQSGSIFTANSGGTPAYTYSWSGPGGYASTFRDPTNLYAGFYSLTITDLNGCTKMDTITLTEPDTLVPLITSTVTNGVNIKCYKGSDGEAHLVSVSGGTPPYNYLWIPGGATTTSISNLTAGDYCLRVTDINGCYKDTCTRLNMPDSIIPAITSSLNNGYQVSCHGFSDASFTVDSVRGGIPPFSYSWSTGDTTSTVSGLSAGTYYLTITDLNGCNQYDTLVAAEPDTMLVVPTSVTNPPCFGDALGSITVSASGGTGVPYQYVWSSNPPDTLQTVTGLSVGTYCVTVTDNNGCTYAACNTLTEPTPMVIDSLISPVYPGGWNVSCNGGTNGCVYSYQHGGTPPYAYLWNYGYSTDSICNVSVVPWYVITVTDSHGCMAADSIAITEPPLVAMTVTANDSVTCFGTSTGSVTITSTGGTAPYSYFLDSLGNPVSNPITGLAAGTYTIYAVDSNGCADSTLVTVGQPPSALNALTGIISNIDCFGNFNGSADVTAGGGTPPYTYAWSDGASTSSATGLSAGTYMITITDARSCTTTATAILTQPSAALNANASAVTHADCNSNNTGSATVAVSGGTPTFTYNWSNADTNQTALGLMAGTYTVTVTDTHGCTAMSTVVITQPASSLSSSASPVTNVDCTGNNSGSATVTVSGGTPAFNYNWSTGDTNQSISGLTAGTYTVSVTDAHNCTSIATVIISEPVAALSANASITSNVDCFGNSTGGVTVAASGGTTVYAYSWSTGSTSQSLSGLPAGTYSVTVTDAHGCTAVSSANVTQPTASLVANVSSSTNVDCNGNNNGDATVIVSGGTPLYTYNWSSPAGTDSTITGLTAGNYSYTVTDAQGCTSTGSVSITEPPLLTAGIASTSITCGQANTGAASVTASGGTPGYNYSWSNGDSASAISGLSAGTYSVTITDVNGCITSISSIVIDRTTLAANAVATQITCGQVCTGIAAVSATGGTPPYNYNWSTTNTTALVTGLCAGTYSVTVSDAQGCDTTIASFVVTTTNLSASITSTNVTCTNANTGSATVTPNNGTPPYTYIWSDGSSNSSATGLSAGTYAVTVTDSLGCVATVSGIVIDSTSLTEITAATFLPCKGDNTGEATVTASGGTLPYTYNWSSGASTSSATGLTSGLYYVTVTDGMGCQRYDTVTVDFIQPATAATGADTSICLENFTNDFKGVYNLNAADPTPGTGLWTILQGSGYLTNAASPQAQYTLPNIATGTNIIAWTVLTGPANQCRTADTIMVTINHEGICLELELPTGFSPNNDGHNDDYDIHGIERFPRNTFVVYNRWGNKVYDKEDYINHAWYGQNNSGDMLPEGTYYVILLINAGDLAGRHFNTYVDLRRD